MGEKRSLKQEINHLEDKLSSKHEYIEALKKQISDNNQHIAKLHDENANLQDLNKDSLRNLQSNLSANDGQYKKLQEKYKTLQGKAQKLANKLKATIVDKKKLKKIVTETKKKLVKVLDENKRIESQTDKQCDSVQHSLEQYKAKIVKKNEQIKKLEATLNKIEQENVSYQNQINGLQKENE